MSVRFVIVGAPRTGSTLLVRTLNRLPGVCCHGELLQLQKVRGFEDGFDPLKATLEERNSRAERLHEQRSRDPWAFIENALNQGALASGLKLTFDIFFHQEWESVIAQLVAQPDIKFIHLQRHNELRRFVSEQMLYAGGPIHSEAGGRNESKMTMAIDIEQFQRRHKHVQRWTNRFRSLTADREVLELSYEELAENLRCAIHTVTDFLSLPAPPTILTAPLKKVGAADLRESVTNFDELLQHPATKAYAQRN